MESHVILLSTYSSPCGQLLLGDFEGRLCMADWIDSPRHDDNLEDLQSLLRAVMVRYSTPLLESAARWLDAYFNAVPPASLPDCPPLLPFATRFRLDVWDKLREIPYGSVCSYSSIARKLGRQSSVRAVAGAIAANPISIFIPCHRVVGTDGSLTGYAGGIEAKRFLLDLEKKVIG